MSFTPRILIVDDDAGIRESLQDILEMQGYLVSAVATGRDALALCSRENFLVALVDIMLEDMKGPGLVEQFVAVSPETEFIYITGHASIQSTIEAVRQDHVVSYETKPLNIDRLVATISQVVKRKEAEFDLRKAHAELERKVLERTRDLQAAHQEREEARLALDAIFYSIPDGIVTVDPEMRVLQANKISMPGLNIEVGKKLDPAANQFQREFCQVLQHTVTTKKPVRELRVEFNPVQGNPRQVVVLNTAPLLDSQKSFLGALLIIRDISALAVLEEKLLERERFRGIVGKSQSMRQVYDLTARLADVDTTILITGDSGTGKEMIVDTLHSLSSRSSAPLVKVNCSALHENLLESELFGHVKGAFTGASSDRSGRIEMAEGGILFLDEIGEVSPRIQLNLLRFLESKEYERVGESVTKKADVRVVTATNIDLAGKVKSGQFREDLYYRLKVMVIHLPPLRERREDIPLLIHHFVNMFGVMFRKTISGLAPEVMEIFMNHGWPGNVRELKHIVEHACILCPGGQIEPSHLPRDFPRALPAALPSKEGGSIRETIIAALGRTDWNLAKTARLLRISRATLYNRLKQLEIERP